MSNTQDELTNLRVTKQLQSYSKAKLIQMVREGKIFGNTKGIVALVEFTNMWFKNIKAQQRL